MEFPTLGKHCHVASCKQLDFLPFKCDYCTEIYCLDHRSPSVHQCANQPVEQQKIKLIECPLCGRSLELVQGDENSIVDKHITNNCDRAQNKNVCSISSCKSININLIGCNLCGKNYCVKHRHPDDHKCATMQQLKQKKEQQNQQNEYMKEYRNQNLKQLMLEREARKIPKNEKDAQRMHALNLMKMKRSAKGKESIPVDNRFYLEIVEFLGKSKTTKNLFFDKNWSIGKVIDESCNHLNIINNNYKPNADRIILINLKEGEMMDTSLKLRELEKQTEEFSLSKRTTSKMYRDISADGFPEIRTDFKELIYFRSWQAPLLVSFFYYFSVLAAIIWWLTIVVFPLGQGHWLVFGFNLIFATITSGMLILLSRILSEVFLSIYVIRTNTTKIGSTHSGRSNSVEGEIVTPIGSVEKPYQATFRAKQGMSNLNKNATSIDPEDQIENIYQKKSPIEHILLRPDSYVGSTQPTEQTQWVYSTKTKSMIQTRCLYVPALYKIFDEILVNAADNKQRDPKMTEIRVMIDQHENKITIRNDGRGIPIAIHGTEGIYVPELVLGQLLTGSNFDDSLAKVTGGRNGYGAKLTNIFSKEFQVTTVDSKRKLSYKQKWKNNMLEREEPIIGQISADQKDFTEISFIPDLEKFGMRKLNGDIVRLMERRVFDIAGCNEGLSVYLNDKQLPNTFSDYIGLYLHHTEESDKVAPIFERINDRWQIAVGLSQNHQFYQVSFVNSISTAKGGTHTDSIVNQITQSVAEKLLKSHKSELTSSSGTNSLQTVANQVRHNLFVFVNCLVENPSFDSQTKETLTTRAEAFGSSNSLPKRFIQRILDETNLEESVLEYIRFKQTSQLNRGLGRKTKKTVSVPKLDDANEAGGSNYQKCSLIITEGDSAKALAISGLSVVGRDHYGVFPLRGKMLNVRDATHEQLVNNEEIAHLTEALGLHFSIDSAPSEPPKLRYGKVIMMMDQDEDGSHIKGLLINFFHRYWPNLLQEGEFLQEFVTPLIKAKHGKSTLSFFSIGEYEKWKNSLDDKELKKWTIKYYKGLGTNTAAEAKEYFSDLNKHLKPFVWNNADESDNLIDMAFRKNRVDDRKAWLRQYDAKIYRDHSKPTITYNEFINQELIQFSIANLDRMIPSLVDGLKTGQRKILYGCFKRKLESEVKVAQLAGYVAEHTSYHHGEQSLQGTIIHMAQDFVGSNNIPLLLPKGQFGTRLEGGKDAASSRYIFTCLNPLTRLIFPEEDDELLEYLNDDGVEIEPKHYVPVIPMVLVNGADGIGSGWSTYVPKYHPVHVVDSVRKRLKGLSGPDLVPWSRGFKGSIEPFDRGFITRGKVEIQKNHVVKITELPIGEWTNSYKEKLDNWTKTPKGQPMLKKYNAYYTENAVDFAVQLGQKHAGESSVEKLYSVLRLENKISLSNLHLKDEQGSIQKYESPVEIVDGFIPIREKYYFKRHEHLVKKLENEEQNLQSKAKFCEAVVEGKIQIMKQSKADIIKQITSMQQSIPPLTDGGYDALLSMPVSSFITERLHKLYKEAESKRKECNSLKKKTPKDLWIKDLDSLQEALEKELEK